MDKLAAWGTNIFSKMSQIALEYNAVNLAQGFPDFDPDPNLLECLAVATKNGANQYARSFGYLPLCHSIQRLIKKEYQVEVNAEEEVTIVPGATFGIYLAFQAFVQPNDEVLVFEPCYDSYIPAIKMAGGIAKQYRSRDLDFKIEWVEVENLITHKTKVIIINNPNNPATTQWTKEDLNQLANLVLKHDLLIFSDEVYEFITYHQKHISILENGDLKSRSIVISSFGKSLHVTGWKCGYCIASPALSSILRKVNQYAVFSAPSPIQAAISNYLDHYFNSQKVKELYLNKKILFEKGLEHSSFEVLPCSGTYFLLVKYGAISKLSSDEFSILLAQKYQVATIPLKSFYSSGYDPHIIRFCFAKKENTLDFALNILAKL